AQTISANAFQLSASNDIQYANFLPHVTINGGQPSGEDFYRISVKADTTYIFDVDYGDNSGGSFDSYLTLYDTEGNHLDSNNNSDTANGAGGSFSGYDAYLVYRFDSAGEYFIVVSGCCSKGPGGLGLIPDDATYKLQISQSIDADYDNMDDNWESRFGLNAQINDANDDADGDGWSNAEEYENGSNPQVADRDNDGIPDNREAE
ncbi:MAG: DVUA0089 family protein, partial [Oleispira sp.]